MNHRPFDGSSLWSRSELDRACALPDHTAAQHVLGRHRHTGPRALSRLGLQCEAERVLTRIEHEPSPDPWLFTLARAIVRRLARAR